MSPIDTPASFDPKAAESRKPKTASATAEAPPNPNLVAFTIDATTGGIVRVEALDAGGDRHDLSEDERARIARTLSGMTLQGVVEQAFQAGIDCVLGADAEPPEAEEEAELSHALLRSLIKGSAASRLLRPEVLRPAIVGTLIKHAAQLRAPGPESAAAH